ncbi:beta-1,6-N-acetylglucosaminyltransferase [Paenibacillus sp. YYML68]|uniref:beta-1,6-N-acetylglucosaminyltransferase n=1 Tax=Paenibacillus sp. YYML68 TaxID=2909250 RepID=UPI0024900C5C|nr:beta-1,6-N-acetylglucosaminyltransferase [Paenibacillus sp. YYML68]
MKYAVCMLAHTKPELVERIVNKIAQPNVEVFIHLDAKCRIDEYSHISNALFIPNRVKVYWGGRSMIVAMHRLMQYVVNSTTCNYLLFISGEDYPLVRPDHYDLYIDPSRNYVEYAMLPRMDWHMGGMKRLRYYYWLNSPSSFLSRASVKLQKMIGLSRNLHQSFAPYGGSQWMNMNREAAQYCLNNWDTYYRYFQYSSIPDELIFQTILMNSPLRESVSNHNLRYIYFENNNRNPSYLNESNYSAIAQSNALFCRKIKDVGTFERMDIAFAAFENIKA